VPPIALRRLWLRLHRWAALGLGWLLALTALLGAALVVAPPLDEWANPQLFHARSAPAVPVAHAPLEPLRQRLLADFGPATALTLRPPRETNDTLWVRVRGAWNGTVYVDPATGLEQGRRGEHEGAFNLLFELHSSLLMADTGKAVLAGAALVYALLLLTGLVLWWPVRWPPRLRIEWRKGLLLGLFDLHRTGGALLGLLILVSVLSGAYMAWTPLRAFVSQLAGQTPPGPPKLGPAAPGSGPSATLDTLVARAQAQFPGQPIGYIHLPAQANRPAQVRFRLPDDPHPNGLSSVWLHPVSGQVLAARRWNELDAGARAVAVIYPLHIGALGGPWHAALTLVTGLSLGALGISGIWLWWRRRRR
jgi:uncharacterized iron-regulated membrane protein